MSKVFVISDIWFNRLFDNDKKLGVIENNEHIIQNWNSTVGKDDVVYVLGGFGICELYHIAIRLNGKIHFLNNYFNSDESSFINEMKDAIRKSSDPMIGNKFKFETNQIVVLKDLDSVLSYFPLEDWPGKLSGTYCFHGINNTMNINEHNISCISSMWDFKPVEISQVKANIVSFNNRF